MYVHLYYTALGRGCVKRALYYTTFPSKSPIFRQDSFHKSAMYYDVLLYCMYVYTHSNIYMHIYIYIDIYIDIRRYSIYRYI